jgi:hypothetical protein
VPTTPIRTILRVTPANHQGGQRTVNDVTALPMADRSLANTPQSAHEMRVPGCEGSHRATDGGVVERMVRLLRGLGRDGSGDE